MARDESDREDLLREATSLVERIELIAETDAPDSAGISAASIVVGFRRSGAISIYFGAEPVYQFNATGELRRAYEDGLLFKAVGGQLVPLERVRTPQRVELRRRAFSQAQQNQFVDRLRQRLQWLRALLSTDALKIVGQVPPERDVIERVKSWLASHQRITIATAPNV